jgi:hypothetical protein
MNDYAISEKVEEGNLTDCQKLSGAALLSFFDLMNLVFSCQNNSVREVININVNEIEQK